MPEEKGPPDRGLSAGLPPEVGHRRGLVGRSCPMKPVVLTDGTQVTLHHIRPEDESALTALYERLSPQTAYQRFFTVMRRLPPDWTHILANVDYDRRMAIVAFGPGSELIGVARYVYDDRTQEAEIAIVIEDRWQGRGLGTRLLGELVGYAEGKGIRRFRAYVLADNLRMLKLIRRGTRILERKLESGVLSLLLAPLGHDAPAANLGAASNPPPAR
jgi:RimJ/RimL family protein N-acetyltransferase